MRSGFKWDTKSVLLGETTVLSLTSTPPPPGYLSHCVISWGWGGWLYFAGTLNRNCMSLTDTWENPSCIVTEPEGPYLMSWGWELSLITVFMSTRVLMKTFNHLWRCCTCNNEWIVTSTMASTTFLTSLRNCVLNSFGFWLCLARI